MKNISKTVWILSLISMFTDMASEMLYPIMPVYLKSIGFSVLLIGILEGIAEAMAGLSKGYFGKMSDQSARRLPFVQIGYALSAISKPMMALFAYPLWIFFARTVDRLGKGIRTGARDALLSDESTHANKGKVFGFHRSMDTVGAVIGPSLALVFLYFNPGNYIYLFYLAFIPGILSVLATFLLKESNKSLSKKISRVRFSELISYWKSSPVLYKKVSAGLLLFTLFNSSDIFLLLMVKQAGMTDTFVIGVYIFYNLVYAMFAYQAGRLADKIGLKKVLIFGLVLFAIVYTGMAWSKHIYIYLILFALYGIYAAATEGISKAWISNISSKEDTATAIGTYAGFQSIFAMPASVIAGFLWFNFGAEVAFGTTAVMTLVVVIYFALLKEY